MKLRIIFDKNSSEWQNDDEYNCLFIKSAINYINNLFLARGYIYENQIYEILGIGWDGHKRNHRALIDKSFKNGIAYLNFVTENKSDCIILKIRSVT